MESSSSSVVTGVSESVARGTTFDHRESCARRSRVEPSRIQVGCFARHTTRTTAASHDRDHANSVGLLSMWCTGAAHLVRVDSECRCKEPDRSNSRRRRHHLQIAARARRNSIDHRRSLCLGKLILFQAGFTSPGVRTATTLETTTWGAGARTCRQMTPHTDCLKV
jgi:hypothetical protein